MPCHYCCIDKVNEQANVDHVLALFKKRNRILEKLPIILFSLCNFLF